MGIVSIRNKDRGYHNEANKKHSHGRKNGTGKPADAGAPKHGGYLVEIEAIDTGRF